MKNKLSTLLFVLTVILGIFLRLHSLTKIALFSDEVDAGYQAYVYNHCLADYSGNKLPFHFQSTSDWRTPLYLVSIAAIQKITGPTAQSVRLPAALFGILSLPIFYLLCKNMFKRYPTAGLIGMFLLAINPWHIHYSRFGFEVTGMLLCILLGLLLYTYFRHTQKLVQLTTSIILLLTSVYFYSTAKLFVPMVIGVILYESRAWLNLKKLLVISLAAFITLVPLAHDTLKGHSSYRFSYTNIFADPTVPTQVNYQRQIYSQEKYGPGIGKKSDLFSKLVFNKLTQWSQKLISNYFSSFSPEFLIGSGDSNLRHNTTIYGNLHLLDLLFIVVGIYALVIKSSKEFPYKKLLISYMLASPLAFSLTNDSPTPHATRLILMLPALLIFATQGILLLTQNSKTQKLCAGLLFILYASSTFVFYVKSTFIYPYLSAKDFHTGAKEALELPFQSPEVATTTWISNSYEPLLPFFLFYNSYLPKSQCVVLEKDIPWLHTRPGFTGRTLESKFNFGKIEWGEYLANQLPSKSERFLVTQDDLRLLKEEIKRYPKSSIVIVNQTTPLYNDIPTFYLLKIN